jgi:Flp pilus assembly protein CpaB
MRPALVLLVPLLVSAAPQQRQVLFAKRDLAAGEILQQADVELRLVPAELFPGAVGERDVATVVRHRLVFPVLAGERIRFAAFHNQGGEPAVAGCLRALGPQAPAADEIAAARQTLIQRHPTGTKRRLSPGR